MKTSLKTARVALVTALCAIAPISAAVADYRAAKDTLQFPFSRPIPFELIDRIVTELLARRRAADARHEH